MDDVQELISRLGTHLGSLLNGHVSIELNQTSVFHRNFDYSEDQVTDRVTFTEALIDTRSGQKLGIIKLITDKDTMTTDRREPRVGVHRNDTAGQDRVPDTHFPFLLTTAASLISTLISQVIDNRNLKANLSVAHGREEIGQEDIRKGHLREAAAVATGNFYRSLADVLNKCLTHGALASTALSRGSSNYTNNVSLLMKDLCLRLPGLISNDSVFSFAIPTPIQASDLDMVDLSNTASTLRAVPPSFVQDQQAKVRFSAATAGAGSSFPQEFIWHHAEEGPFELVHFPTGVRPSTGITDVAVNLAKGCALKVCNSHTDSLTD